MRSPAVRRADPAEVSLVSPIDVLFVDKGGVLIDNAARAID